MNTPLYLHYLFNKKYSDRLVSEEPYVISFLIPLTALSFVFPFLNYYTNQGLQFQERRIVCSEQRPKYGGEHYRLLHYMFLSGTINDVH